LIHLSSGGRDWDSQSASESNTGHSVGSGPSSMGPPSGVGAAMSSSASLGLPPNQIELMRETVNKRIMTLTYLRSTHEGYVGSIIMVYTYTFRPLLLCRKMYWFNTILLTREALAETFNAPVMKKRYASSVHLLNCRGSPPPFRTTSHPLLVHLWRMLPVTRPTSCITVACRSVHWSNVN
jgi:hypothetical protein